VQIWPSADLARPYPLGATYDGSGVNFALFSEIAEPSSSASSTTTGTETRVDLPEVDGFVWHGYLPGSAARTALRLPRPRPRTPRATATAATRPSCCSTRTPRPSTGQMDGDQSLFGYDFTDPTAAPTRSTASATRCSRSSSTRSSTGARTAAAPRVPRHRHLRGARQGPDDAPPRGARGDPRDVCRHRPPRDHRPPEWTSGVTAIELMPVHQFVQDFHLQDKGLRTTGATTPSASSPRTTAMPPTAAVSRCRVQDDGQGAARRRHRGHPRRGLQPHRRGQPPRPDAVASAASTTRPTTASSRRPGATTTTTPAAATASTCAPARAAADHGLAALLGHRDARRRLPLRPRRHAGARVPRGRQALAFFDLIQQDPVLSQVKLIAEPWDSAKAATRSATSRRCGPSGTASTATPCATSGRARRH
jgi:hypothetical protein